MIMKVVLKEKYNSRPDHNFLSHQFPKNTIRCVCYCMFITVHSCLRECMLTKTSKPNCHLVQFSIIWSNKTSWVNQQNILISHSQTKFSNPKPLWLPKNVVCRKEFNSLVSIMNFVVFLISQNVYFVASVIKMFQVS